MNQKIFGIFAQTTFILAIASIYVLNKWSDKTGPFVILLGVVFGATWFIYFYRVWKIERSPVKFTKIRDLTAEEKKPLQDELSKVQNSVRNSIFAFFVTSISLVLFITGFSFSTEFKESLVGIITSWIFMIGILSGSGVFVFNVSKIDRKRALEKDINEGIVQIEGSARKMNLSITQLDIKDTNKSRTSSIKSIRMGKYDFPLKDEQTTQLYNEVIEEGFHKIVFSPGTKNIRKIEKL